MNHILTTHAQAILHARMAMLQDKKQKMLRQEIVYVSPSDQIIVDMAQEIETLEATQARLECELTCLRERGKLEYIIRSMWWGDSLERTNRAHVDHWKAVRRFRFPFRRRVCYGETPEIALERLNRGE
jgi:hypothetical protein